VDAIEKSARRFLEFEVFAGSGTVVFEPGEAGGGGGRGGGGRGGGSGTRGETGLRVCEETVGGVGCGIGTTFERGAEAGEESGELGVGPTQLGEAHARGDGGTHGRVGGEFVVGRGGVHRK